MNGNFDIDERIKQYLLERLQSQNTSNMPNGPQQIAARDNIQSQALAGMAGGFAQMGTLYGKTPDAGPAIKSLTGTSQALQQGLDRMAPPKLDIDPRVLKYVTEGKNKKTEYKPLSNPLAGNKQGFYNPENPNEIITGPPLYQKPDAPKEPKPPKADESAYRFKSIKNHLARMKSIISNEGTFDLGSTGAELKQLVYNLAVDYAKAVDPDSVAREAEVEAARKFLAPILEWNGLRYSNKQAMDILQRFESNLLEREDAYKSSLPKNNVLPNQPSPTPAKRQLTPAEKDELEQLRKRKAAQQPQGGK
jgi:hypothetical protein